MSSRRDFLRSLGIGTAVATAASGSSQSLCAALVQDTTPGETDHVIHLERNENPYGPSRRTAEAIRRASTLANRYPLAANDLIGNIARLHGVKSEQVILGCGSTEILRVAAQAFLGPKKKLLQGSPAFDALGFYARSVQAEVISLPLTHDYSHDLASMAGRTTGSTMLVYICNPNNPTGSITPRKAIEEFIRKLPAGVLVLIDEAYHHYAGESSMYASFIDHPLESERVIVTRTFSAVYGLAGLRLGYGIASSKLAEQMRAFCTFDSVNTVALHAAIEALADTEAVQTFIKRNADDRQEFFNQAMARMLKPIDSHTNFVMMNTNRSAKEVIEHFRQHGVIIGPFLVGMDTYVRVSLGTPSEMGQFWQVWDRLPKAEMQM